MPPKVSNRAEEVAASVRSNKRHVSDVVGAKGCYYCWLGQYDKCEAHCCKVPKLDASVSSGEYAIEAFDRATPFLTEMYRQSKSIFDETSAARKRAQRFHEVLTAERQIEQDIRMGIREADSSFGRVAPSSSPKGVSGSPMVNAALYDRRSAASRRHPELKSIHPPQISHTLFKKARGAEEIRVTPYTVVCVTPSTHMYAAHHRDDLESGDSIWTGWLVKEGRVARDAFSQQVAHQLRLGGTPSQSRSISPRVGTSRVARGNGTSPRRETERSLRVNEDPVSSYILSGGYRSTTDLPLPAVFDYL